MGVRCLGRRLQCSHKLVYGGVTQIKLLHHLGPRIVVREKPLPHQKDGGKLIVDASCCKVTQQMGLSGSRNTGYDHQLTIRK